MQQAQRAATIRSWTASMSAPRVAGVVSSLKVTKAMK